MEKINLNEYLASNEYPGRGIAVAMVVIFHVIVIFFTPVLHIHMYI